MPKPINLTPEVVARCRRALAFIGDGYAVHLAVKRARTSTNAVYAYAEHKGIQVKHLSKSLAFKSKQ